MRIVIYVLIIMMTGCSQHKPLIDSPPIERNITLRKLNQQFVKWKGTPYRYGGMSRGGVDCSGLVWLVFNQGFDINLPRTTLAQSKIGTAVGRKDLQPGDLLFFRTGRGRNGLHVGIYSTRDKFIHASTARGVIYSSLSNTYWRKVFWQGRRL